MNQLDRFKETIASYRKHGWQLRRVLMCEQTRNLFKESGGLDLYGIEPVVIPVDAVWFSRPSHAGREAWELRLVDETAYALFDAFEPDIDDESREEKLQEMQARMIEYAKCD
jgi:hypothetical protein